MSSYDLIIIGAGISGLVCAHRAVRAGRRVALLEETEDVGGVIRSRRQDGFLLEFGPNTVMPTAEIMRVVEEVGLTNRVRLADAKAPRYVLHGGRLHPIPMSPPALLTTSLLSVRGRLRLLMEPLIPAPTRNEEETLMTFARRRLGTEAAERLLAPFVSGVWAGDADRLSASASFPKLKRLETEHGSLFRGMIKSRKRNKNKPPLPKGLLSFEEGLQELPHRIAEKLGDVVHRGVTPHNVERTGKRDFPWSVATNRGALETKTVVLASPPSKTARLLSPLDRITADALNDIPFAPIAVIHFGIRKEHVQHDLNGFGYLVAPSENRTILGCLWNSSLFPNRAPEGYALLTVFMGGARNAAIVAQSEESLIDAAIADIRPTLGLSRNPEILSFLQYDRAIPQYTIGHTERVGRLRSFERENAGIWLTGNYLEGISVGDVVKHADTVVDLIIDDNHV